MCQLKDFVVSIEAEISRVLCVLQDVVEEVFVAYEHVRTVQAIYEKRKLDPDCPTLAIENKDIQQSLSTLRTIILTLDIEVGKTLSLAGVRLDAIRTRIINGKMKFHHMHNADQLFEAVDKLILELDNICISLERNLNRISTTIHSMDEWT